MEYSGSSYGYDQVVIDSPMYYNKEDSSLLYKDRMNPSDDVLKYMTSNKVPKKTSDAAFEYYLRKNIKDEIEKYEMRKPQYTGMASNAPESSGYPLCDASKALRALQSNPQKGKEGMSSHNCLACSEHSAVNYKKKYDSILFLVLVVVVAFCMSQFSRIHSLQKQIFDITTTPLRGSKPVTA